MNLLYPWLFLPFRLSSYSSYLMISLHLLHCVPQSFKRRTIQWVFPPTVKHNLIANREKHITHRYITNQTRGGAWTPIISGRIYPPGGLINIFDEAGSPLILGSGWAGPHLFLRIWTRRNSYGNLIVIAWLLIFGTESVLIIFFIS